jgi:exonuclease 3'-5' domain-containing protein 1
VPDIVRRIQVSSLQEVGCGYLVDSREAVANLVDSLLDLPASPLSIYIDIKGVNLYRFGSISILQILVLLPNKTYLVNFHVLKGNAFTIAGEAGQTLKDVLESVTIPKVFFNVQNDSDVLFSHFGIKLRVQDIQLMELATQMYNRKYVKGLSKYIENDLTITASEKRTANSTETIAVL